jgi:hypothetical protein
MPDGQEQLVVLDKSAVPRRIDARDIGDVIPIRLEPSDHRILCVHDPRFALEIKSVERSVIAYLSSVREVERGWSVKAMPSVRTACRVSSDVGTQCSNCPHHNGRSF